LRGTCSKLEVFFRPSEAKLLLHNDLFINDNDSFEEIVRAMAIVFSDFNVFHFFSETAVAGRTRRHVVCLLAHAALITTKIRAHLAPQSTAPKRAHDAEGDDAADDDDDDADDDDDEDCDPEEAGPRRDHSSGLKPDHHPLWIQELAILGGHVAGQGATAVSGLRLSDGADPLRAVVTPSAPAPEPSAPPAATTTAGASQWSAGDVPVAACPDVVGAGDSSAAGAAGTGANATGSNAGVAQHTVAAGRDAGSCSD